MTEIETTKTANTGRVTISVDAMGGDLGPAAIVAGIAKSAQKNPDVAFLVFGPQNELAPLIEKRGLTARCQVRDVREVVTMDALSLIHI